ncbi:Holliday junction resolvase RuvX [Patescibacteria group bacterium]|nr:Holliday junction resolvase RuvX [Patescibacteria group bacterium]
MPILGIDYGDRKVGLAISDDKHKLAMPLSIIQNTGDKNLAAEIKQLCQKDNIEKVVVGLPLSKAPLKKDLQNEQIQKVIKFIKLLQKNFPIKVVTEDERMTSKMAGGLLRSQNQKTKDDDAVAAMLILQTYLDKHN